MSLPCILFMHLVLPQHFVYALDLATTSSKVDDFLIAMPIIFKENQVQSMLLTSDNRKYQ